MGVDNHRTHVVPEDVQAVLPSVVEHRLRESADFAGHGGGALAQKLLGSVDVVSASRVQTAQPISAAFKASALVVAGPAHSARAAHHPQPGERLHLSHAFRVLFGGLLAILDAGRHQLSEQPGLRRGVPAGQHVHRHHSVHLQESVGLEHRAGRSAQRLRRGRHRIRRARRAPKGSGREGIQIGWPEGFKQWVEISTTEARVVSLYVKRRHVAGCGPGGCWSKPITRLGCCGPGPG